MLKSLFHSDIALGLAQAAIAAVMALAVVLLARRRNIHLEADASVALLRGIVQIVAVGSILVLLLKAPRWTSVFLLAGMVLAAGSISAKRAKNIPGVLKVSTYSIAVGNAPKVWMASRQKRIPRSRNNLPIAEISIR